MKEVKDEGRVVTLDKENLDDVVLEVGKTTPESVKSVDKDDKQLYDEFKTMYKNLIDEKFKEEYGTSEDKDLWEDVAKELFLKSKTYIPEEDIKAEADLSKITESKEDVMNDKVKDWYFREFPDEEPFREDFTNGEVTFRELYDRMNKGEDPYIILGIGDSTIREGVFAGLADRLNVDYKVIYDLWLHGPETSGLIKKPLDVEEESYSEKLGGEPEDFIKDLEYLRQELNNINLNEVATKLAAEMVLNFIDTIDTQINLTKGKYNLEEAKTVRSPKKEFSKEMLDLYESKYTKKEEDQYEAKRRRGVPAITRTAETEYYDNEDWYKEHKDDYTNVSDFVEKEIAEIASEYNLSEEIAKKVCEKIFELMTNTKITESAKAFLPLDNYHSIAIEEINYGIDDTVTYAYYEGDKVIDGPFESKIEYEEDGTPYFLDEQGKKWMISDFMRSDFTESKKQETTDKELQSMKAKIPNYTQVPYAEWTDEQKELDNIISCIRMIHSLLIYNYPNATEKDIEHILADKYLQEHIKTLSREKVRELLAKEIKEFESATVHRDVYTDGEGVSYNSVKFKDESKTIKE